jgi:hypothetical protein
VAARDGQCVFAGCTAPAAFCDIHHVIHWAYGGPTSCENAAPVCERHHTAVHEGGFTIFREPATAVWHTYAPMAPRSSSGARRPDGHRRPGARPVPLTG